MVLPVWWRKTLRRALRGLSKTGVCRWSSNKMPSFHTRMICNVYDFIRVWFVPCMICNVYDFIRVWFVPCMICNVYDFIRVWVVPCMICNVYDLIRVCFVPCMICNVHDFIRVWNATRMVLNTYNFWRGLICTREFWYVYLFSYVYIRRQWLKIDSCIKRYALQIVHVKNLTRCKRNTLLILHVIKATRIKSYTYENIHVWNGEFWLVLKHTRMKSFTLLLIRVSFYTRNFWYAYRFMHETFDKRMFSSVKLFIRGTFGAFCPLWQTIGH